MRWPGLVLTLWAMASPALCSWDKGFDFRASSGFVTDPTNTTYVLDTDIYPTTRNSVTFGWITGLDPDTLGGGGRDRNAGIDARIAGMNFCGNQQSRAKFQVDLPGPGTYTIQLGYGDAGGNSQNNYLIVSDSGTNLITLGPVVTAATPTFGDAIGSTYTAAVWPGSEAIVTKTFSSSTAYLFIGSNLPSDGTNSTITHLFLSQQSAPTTATGNLVISGSGSGSITFSGAPSGATIFQ